MTPADPRARWRRVQPIMACVARRLEDDLSLAALARQDIRADTLPGGPVAATTHMGAYEKLNEAHAAVQVWMEEKNLRSAGAPWEVYVSDPAQVPDPASWRTDIFWPLQR